MLSDELGYPQIAALLLPLAFGQLALGLTFTAIWGAVLFYKIQLEDQALTARRATAAGIS